VRQSPPLSRWKECAPARARPAAAAALQRRGVLTARLFRLPCHTRICERSSPSRAPASCSDPSTAGCNRRARRAAADGISRAKIKSTTTAWSRREASSASRWRCGASRSNVRSWPKCGIAVPHRGSGPAATPRQPSSMQVVHGEVRADHERNATGGRATQSGAHHHDAHPRP
jgi:hypothetical protein